MTDITLGQSIAGALTATDPTNADGNYANEYNFTGLDSFRQRTINVQLPAGTTGSTSAAGSGNLLCRIDLVDDAAKSRFFATAFDRDTSEAL
jgi:hypothetical protein